MGWDRGDAAGRVHIAAVTPALCANLGFTWEWGRVGTTGEARVPGESALVDGLATETKRGRETSGSPSAPAAAPHGVGWGRLARLVSLGSQLS